MGLLTNQLDDKGPQLQYFKKQFTKFKNPKKANQKKEAFVINIDPG